MNESYRVTVKTPVGVTDEFVLENIEMQGTVPAPLKCAAQMDGLGKKFYTSKKYLYQYNDSCYVPCLGMIDDTFIASRCGLQSVQVNALINTFIEGKKLYFTTKCFVMHLGPKANGCPQLKVHSEQMRQTSKEKYLGDIISVKGNIDNIEKRRMIGNQAISDMLAVLREIGQGPFYVKTGLIFRDAILKCKLLLNSEVWHCLTMQQVEMLEDLDKQFLRNILKSHSKVAIEILYFETGKFPYRYDIMMRRLMYLWKILTVDRNELIFRVFKSQCNSPHQGDWVKQIDNDRKNVELDLDDLEISEMSKTKFKTIVNKKVTNLAIAELNKLKDKHSKSAYLKSDTFAMAPYLADSRFSKRETQVLFRLRSQTLDARMNFGNQFSETLCRVCKLFPETQSHLLQCPEMSPRMKLVCSSSNFDEKLVYGNIDEQLQIIKIYCKILDMRKEILDED